MSKPHAVAGRLILPALAILAAVAAVPPSAATANAAPSGTAFKTGLVTLVTGDQVSVTSGGGHVSYTFLPHTARSAVQFYRDGTGDEYAIPATAAPYVGRGLDRSLFDVSALLRNGDAAKIPVDLSFAAGSAPAAPAGVTLTATGGTTASGYLTAASAAEFGAALRQRIGADVAAGRRPGTTPLSGLADLSLTGAATSTLTPGTVHTDYVMHLLRISAIDQTGAPAAGPFVMLMNTDELNRENGLIPVENGAGRIQVPAGNYAAVGFEDDYDASGNVTATRQVVVSDFTVPSTGTVPTLTVDFRTATTQVTASTPRPSVMQAVQVSTLVKDGTGAVNGGIDAGIGIPTYTNAAPAPRSGTLHYVVQWDGAAANAADGYRYDVAFATDGGIPTDEAYTVRQDQLATVRQNFSADPAATGTGTLDSGALDPTMLATNGLGTVAAPEPMPGAVTQYLGTADGGAWTQGDFTPGNVALFSNERVFASRRDYSVDWAHGPIAPNWGRYTGPGEVCDACSSGDDLSIVYNLAADSEPDHQFIEMPGPTSAHLTVYRDGTTVFDQNLYYGANLTGIPLTPSTYRAVFDTDMSGVAGFSQSTATHTDATFKYDPTADSGSTLPAADHCFQPTTTTPCQVLPVLALNYNLATDRTGTSTWPFETLGLDVGHLSYDGFGSHSPITSATVSVSFDGGTTWRAAHLAGFAGHYLAAWPNQAATGTKPMLKVTAADANGDTISQTITGAYTIGGGK